MRVLLMIIVLTAAAILLAAHFFNAYFEKSAEGHVLPDIPEQESKPDEQASGGGSPRNPDYRPPHPDRTASTSAPGGFQGPSGPPYIVGPSGPPPDKD